ENKTPNQNVKCCANDRENKYKKREKETVEKYKMCLRRDYE
ncbi:17709_t:CDS:1, partial [Cetraspora pellucida]